MITPPYLPGGLEAFVNLAIPELQRRGLTRREYLGSGHLRDERRPQVVTARSSPGYARAQPSWSAAQAGQWTRERQPARAPSRWSGTN
jgi:hypothetical protein